MLLLLAGLDRSRFSPLIVLHIDDGPLAWLLRENSIPYEVLCLSDLAGSSPSLRKIAAAQLKNYGRLGNFIRKHDVDIVHTNDLRCSLTWGAVSRLHAKHVWHQRTILSDAAIWRTMGFWANHVICISLTVRKSYKSFAPTTVLANPFSPVRINRTEARAALVAELGVDSALPIVGYVGRFVSRKGLEDFCLLPTLLPEAVLVAAGGGPLASVLPSAIRRLGFRHPIEPVIAGLDVLVAPSHYEGFGRTVAEAMLAGTPVVASDIPAHRETSDNGRHAVLVRPGSAQELARGVRDLLRCGDRAKKLMEGASLFVENHYSQTSHVKAVEAVYESIL